MNPFNDPFGSAQRAIQDFQRHQDLINKTIAPLNNSAALQAVQTWQKHQDLINKTLEPFNNSAAQQAAQVWQRHQDLINKTLAPLNNSAALQAVQTWQKHQDLINKTLEPFNNSAAEKAALAWQDLFAATRRDLEQLYGPGLVGRAAAAAAALNNPSFAAALDELRSRSFLVDALARVREPRHSSEVGGILDGIVGSFAVHLARAKTWIEQQSLLVIFMLVISLFTLYYQRASYLNDLQNAASQETPKALESGLQELGEKFDRLAEKLTPPDRTHTQLSAELIIVTAERANLRGAPARTGKRAGMLHRGDVSEVLDRKGAWYLVRHYDALTGQIQLGWIYSRLARVISER